MKLIKTLIILPILVLALVGCKDDDDATLPTVSAKNGFDLTLSYDIRVGETLTFTASDNWTVSDLNDAMVSLSKTSGGAGENTIKVKARDYNCTNEDAHYTFSITSTNEHGTSNVKVYLTHEPVFVVDTLDYEADALGDTIDIHVRSKALAKYPVYVYQDVRTDAEQMVRNISEGNLAKAQTKASGDNMQCLGVVSPTRAANSSEEVTLHIVISPNTTSRIRKGVLWLAAGDTGGMFSDGILITQLPADSYCSQDMETENGKVTQLQKHKKGKGVPVVIMGDGFLDRDITGGKYREATNMAMEALFSVHPMTALRDYFDVYEVTAVSYNDYFSTSSSTAFSSQFASYTSTEISGDNDKAMEYAAKAVGEGAGIENALIIILVNEDRYAGTCYMYSGYEATDIPRGCSVAYVPLTASGDDQTDFEGTILHEAIGHGFAKLADEYDDVELVKIPDKEKQDLQKRQKYGLYRNVVFDADVTKSYWADFAADSRYLSEHLGCYEGGATYALGVYRPTENSIMNDNTGGFNVAGRVMIYKRCMSIALGSSWKYSYADFTAFDLEEGKAEASGRRKSPVKRSGRFVPLATPKVIMRSK